MRLFYENRLGIKKSVISLFTFLSEYRTKFRAPYQSNHVIPHRERASTEKMKESEDSGRRRGGGGGVGGGLGWERGDVSSPTTPTPNQPLLISISLPFNVTHGK